MGIGMRLEELMKRKGINANELAQMIGVTPSTIYSMIKRDSNRIDIDLIIKIAHAFNITADELLEAGSARTPHTIAAHFDADEFTAEELKEIETFIGYVKSKRS